MATIHDSTAEFFTGILLEIDQRGITFSLIESRQYEISCRKQLIRDSGLTDTYSPEPVRFTKI